LGKGLVKSQKYMGKTNDQRPSTKPAAQPFNLKPDLVWYKMEYQKFLTT